MFRRTHNLAILAVAAVAAAVPVIASDAAAETLTTDKGPLVIHPVEHATFVMEWNGMTVFVDPVGGADSFAAFASPDLILITHIHGDHTDPETLKAVSTAETRLVVTATVDEMLDDSIPGRRTILANGEHFEHAGITVDAIPAYNTTENRLHYHPKGRDNGYVVNLGGRLVYISGDTEDIPEMRALESIEAAFVCMNLPYTMDVEQAGDAVLDFAPAIVYPYHYRGKDGMSDLQLFKKIVGPDPGIDVRELDWY